jgi:hypothetical protein
MTSKRVEQEGRIELAIQALKKGEINSIRRAAIIYGVPRSTLSTRMEGTTPRHETPANSMKLTQDEQDSLAKWLLDVDDHGYSASIDYVRRKANLLLAERVRDTSRTPPTVGKNWATNFVKRRPDLCPKYNRKYDYQRALCEDRETMAN